MGLNIDVISPEEPLRPIARQRLDNIRVLTTPVIALARVAFRVFVGEDRASRLKNGAAHEVLGSDHLQAFMLAKYLVLDLRGDFGIYC